MKKIFILITLALALGSCNKNVTCIEYGFRYEWYEYGVHYSNGNAYSFGEALTQEELACLTKKEYEYAKIYTPLMDTTTFRLHYIRECDGVSYSVFECPE